MKIIDCILVDDEKLARDLLAEFIAPYEAIEIVAQCSKGKEAVERIDELRPKLVFMDVQMPGMDGFDVLEAIEHKPYVIFTTAYDQYAIRAFDKNAIDYVLKPLDKERFQVAVERAIERVQKEENNVDDLIKTLRTRENDRKYATHLFVQKSEKLLNIDVNNIMQLEASGDYTVLITKSDQFLSSSGIGKLEEKLDPATFIRIHRSTIINLNYLKEIEKHFNGGMIVKMENGKSFPVSRTYAKHIKQKVV